MQGEKESSASGEGLAKVWRGWGGVSRQWSRYLREECKGMKYSIASEFFRENSKG